VSTCVEDPAARPAVIALTEHLLACARKDQTLTVRVPLVDPTGGARAVGSAPVAEGVIT
jgi:hypothetical protein